MRNFGTLELWNSGILEFWKGCNYNKKDRPLKMDDLVLFQGM